MDSIGILFEIKRQERESSKVQKKLEAEYVKQLLREHKELQDQGRGNYLATQG